MLKFVIALVLLLIASLIGGLIRVLRGGAFLPHSSTTMKEVSEQRQAQKRAEKL